MLGVIRGDRTESPPVARLVAEPVSLVVKPFVSLNGKSVSVLVLAAFASRTIASRNSRMMLCMEPAGASRSPCPLAPSSMPKRGSSPLAWTREPGCIMSTLPARRSPREDVGDKGPADSPAMDPPQPKNLLSNPPLSLGVCTWLNGVTVPDAGMLMVKCCADRLC